MTRESATLGETRMVMQTDRLDLVAATLEIVTADLHQRELLPALLGAEIGAGWPPPLMDVRAMQHLKQSLGNESMREGWGAWYWVLRSLRQLIGISGFKNRPINGAVELGYSVLPQFQKRGLATEAIAAMVDWAFAHGAECVFAETLPELAASQRVLIKNGFARAIESSDPGVLRFERVAVSHSRDRLQ